MKKPFALIGMYAKLAGNLGKVRGMALLYKSFQNKMVCSVQLPCVSHGIPFPDLIALAL